MTPEIASGYRAFNQEIKPLMQKILRWQKGNYLFVVKKTAQENNWQHVVKGTPLVAGCIPMAVDFLHRYPELCLGKRKIRKKIVYQELLGHDLGEWREGDVSLHSPKYHEKMANNWERDDFLDLQEKYALPKLFLTLFDSFHDWKTTKEYRPESIFARFIDCYQGSFFYLTGNLKAGMSLDPTEMDKIEERTIAPLAYLRQYYENDPRKLEALDRLHDEISEQIANLFDPDHRETIKIKSRAAFENLASQGVTLQKLRG